MKTIIFIWLCYFVIVLLGCVGWYMNIAKFAKCDFKEPYKAEIWRGIGIVAAPIGAVEGFITIQDGNQL